MMTGRMDGVTLSMTRAIVDAQEVQAAAQRATQFVEMQQRESLRIEAEDHLRQTRALWGGAASRRAASGRPVEAVERRPDDAESRPSGGRRNVARAGSRRDADAPADGFAPMASLAAHPSLGTRLDLRT